MMVNNISPMNNQQRVNFKGIVNKVGKTTLEFDSLHDGDILRKISTLTSDSFDTVREFGKGNKFAKNGTTQITFYKDGTLEIIEDSAKRTLLPDEFTFIQINKHQDIARDPLEIYAKAVNHLKSIFGIE